MTSSHPRGLHILFFTEMWERFSYYGMRALLVLYLVNALDYPRARALSLYATYTGLVYLTPILGGYLADKWLGSRRAVLVGGMVMAMGHFAMAVPALLHLALGLLITGNGFFKPNISTIVGSLYRQNDPRRDSGFTIFYMGINLGAFLSPLVCGTLAEKFGWHYGFAAAGVGMLAGLLVFILGQSQLGQTGFPPRRMVTEESRLTASDWHTIAVTSLACLGLVYAVVNLWPYISAWWQALNSLTQIGLGLALILIAVWMPRMVRAAGGRRLATEPHVQSLSGMNSAPRLARVELHRMLAILIIGVFVVFFWMGFEQAGGTMNLFADKLTERQVFGWEIPASYFQAINPLAIILLAPLFSMFWVRLDRSRFALSSVAKQGIGMIILGLGFVVLAVAQQRADLFGRVGPGWLVAVYVLHTIGELCLSPIGLSMVTKLAPARLVSLMMGLWFTMTAIANYLAGTLEIMLQGSVIPLYWFLVGSSIGAGILLLLLTPVIRRLMHGIT
ncbi:MAG TPA: peptide MFS transporter [Acidiferrobacterales bacterium]|nr:peptide MFS transporter [Acidiferrobacterales bacterium]